MEMPSLAPSEEADMESADCEILPSEPPTEPSPIIQILENDFTKTAEQAVSTFSADVDTASYTYLRKLTSVGYKFDQLKATAGRAIRTEELVNYFSYNYSAPKNGELLGKNVTISKSPWNNDTMLLTIGLKAPEAEVEVQNNLVFLIDVSGSMSGDDKLGLLKKAFSYLTENLDKNDRVSIVTYAGNERVVLDGCEGYRKADILAAINNLQSGGSTNGEAGIVKAYELAEKHFIAGGNNRIIMASDGDLNVGISSPEELTNLVSEKRDSGVFLSILGFGTGNFRDDNMSALAQNGNGVYHYIDCEAEAERIFTEKLLSSIRTVAKDVKLQITFNPDAVAEYRLIGYENRLLNTEDFADDTKDAGDMGSGHTVTVCYEIKLTDTTANVDSFATIAIRYKQPDGIKSELEEYNVTKAHLTSTPDKEQQFVATVVEFSMLLRGSKFANKETTTLENLISRLEALDLDNEKAELLDIMKKLS
jgi:Ca-activated chloride channel family protein